MEFARSCNHNYIGTEHLLLGIFREQHNLAARMLRKHGITQENLIRKIFEILQETSLRDSQEATSSVSQRETVEGSQPFRFQGVNSFTANTKNVIITAKEEVLRFRHNALDCEHMLLGLLREEEGVGILALQAFDVDIDRMRSDLEHRLIPGSEGTQSTDIPFSPSVKDALRLAIGLADEFGHASVGFGHLLLGILGEGKNLGALILREYGITENALKAYVMTHEQFLHALQERNMTGFMTHGTIPTRSARAKKDR